MVEWQKWWDMSCFGLILGTSDAGGQGVGSLGLP
jgi:hypothetical protein